MLSIYYQLRGPEIPEIAWVTEIRFSIVAEGCAIEKNKELKSGFVIVGYCDDGERIF